MSPELSPRRSWPRRPAALVTMAPVTIVMAVTTVVAAMVVAALPATASAQQPPAPVDTTTTMPSTTIVPPAEPPTVPPAEPPAATSTVPAPPVTNPDGTAVTTTAPDPFAGTGEPLSSGAYATQPPFDPSSVLPLASEVARYATAVDDAGTRLRDAQAAVQSAAAELTALANRMALVGEGRRVQVAGAATSKANLRRRAVAAFIRGDQSATLFVVSGDPAEYSRANRYLETIAGLDQNALDAYRAGIARMDGTERALVDAQSDLDAKMSSAAAERDADTGALMGAQRCLDAAKHGSRVCPDGFVFPVLGEVNFGDSWGAPRLMGTPDQHWHEGTDIMAPTGREIVATENGMLSQVGDAGLGGNRLWLHGDSGTDYYYAHFSAFAPGIADGVVVTAGTVVGYAGATGDAAGGPSHLHFEIHPGGGRPVSPFPLLRATWGENRPMLSQAEVLDGIPGAVAPLPDEER